MKVRLGNHGEAEREISVEAAHRAPVRVQSSTATPSDLPRSALRVPSGNPSRSTAPSSTRLSGGLPVIDRLVSAGPRLLPSRDLLGLVWLVSLAGIAAFVVAVAVLHGVAGDLNPMQHTISEYSLSQEGWMMRAAFGALALGAVGVAVGMGSLLEVSPLRGVGLFLLVGAGFGLFLDAGYNTDHLRVAETFDGAVHGDGMLIVCLCLPTAAFILGSSFVRCAPMKWRARCLQVLGLAQLIAVRAFEVSPNAFRGLTERIAVAIGILSLVLLHSLIPRHRPAERKTGSQSGSRAPRSVGDLLPSPAQVRGIEVSHAPMRGAAGDAANDQAPIRT